MSLIGYKNKTFLAILFAHAMATASFAANAVYPHFPFEEIKEPHIFIPEELAFDDVGPVDPDIPTLEELLADYPGFDEDEDVFDENNDVVDMDIDESRVNIPTIIITLVHNTTATE